MIRSLMYFYVRVDKRLPRRSFFDRSVRSQCSWAIPVQLCQKHYAPWVKTRQDALEEAVKGMWV